MASVTYPFPITQMTTTETISECCGYSITGGRCSKCLEGCVGEEVEIDDIASAHTAGPWQIDANCEPSEAMQYEISAAGEVVAIIKTRKSYIENARLIAAAPDLLEACKAALSEGDDYVAIKKLKAAIAKAEGSSPSL